ncbi:hypothetical protein PR048_017175 [Dryococelus australis]|uniref:DUF4371 domain-containing protein n=1 Tax=Dryococelus australis TaxID=614101 RepID=A0ABQ9H906_9NEOP|nr:hypothetical protein PR048_017175 [Dryococelus australis]
MSTHKAAKQKIASEYLLVILSSWKCLAKEGLTVRKHFNNKGDLIELFKLRSLDVTNMTDWLQQDRWKMMHPEIQNEVLEIFKHELVKILWEKIKSNDPLIISIICNGTHDVSGLEQESVCVCWVDGNFEPQESFLGFFQASSTTGVAISCLIQDILLRLHLPLASFCGQTYDGAGNMSGSQKGTQARISEKQLLAPFVHCGAHCVNLAMMDCCETTKKSNVHWIGVMKIVNCSVNQLK